jgi:isoleucyl-tRNA synthetase
MYCEANPGQAIKFGYGPAAEVKRRLLTLWNSVAFLSTYANIEGFRPRYEDLEVGPSDVELRALDRWLLARTQSFLAETEAAYERYWTPDVVAAFERFVDDVSNWYIRRSRRRFYSLDEAAFRTLWYALVQGMRGIAPVMPFLAERLWRHLVAGPCEAAPDSVFLAGWPLVRDELSDDRLVAEVDETRRVVDLGRQARSVSGLKLRQPLRRLVVEGAELSQSHVDEIREELRVKEVEFGEVEASELRVRPNLPVLGPKLGRELAAVRSALEAGDFEALPNGRYRAAGHELAAGEVLVERHGKEGFSVASGDSVTVALDTQLDEELEREGRVYDLIHTVNTMRKEAGLELTDRILLEIPEADADLLPHADWIARETLALEVEANGSELRLAKAE